MLSPPIYNALFVSYERQAVGRADRYDGYLDGAVYPLGAFIELMDVMAIGVSLDFCREFPPPLVLEFEEALLRLRS